MKKLILVFVILISLVMTMHIVNGQDNYLFPIKEPIMVDGKIWLSSWFYLKRADYHGKIYGALNIPCREGTKVYNVLAGTVIETGYMSGEGISIKVMQIDGIIMQYSHLGNWNCKIGDKLNKGDVVGYVGRTGQATGHHLRLIAWKNGKKFYITKMFFPGEKKFHISASGKLDKEFF